MKLLSGLRPVRRWRILLAHGATAACDPLFYAIESALGSVDLSEAVSVDGARAALQSGQFNLCMVCLDLPPAPVGGVRLAQEVLDEREVPLLLVTRSMRWIPPHATALRNLPWLAPDASANDVARAVEAVMEAFGYRSPSLVDGDELAHHDLAVAGQR